MKREDRYLVLKRSDIEAAEKEGYISPAERGLLYLIAGKVAFWRYGESKPELKCVVVESDWPEYEHVWELIRLRVEKATISPENVQGVVDAPGVDAALRAFTEDATNDNAFFLVRAIMEACLPRAPESDADQS